METLNRIINDIELKPKMFFANPDYAQLPSYLFGYLTCIDDIHATSLNRSFSEWLNNRGKKTSLFWTEYILKISSNNDQVAANKIVIKEFKLFLSDIALEKKSENSTSNE
ncbi:hypothetical protein ACFFLS_00830 [Flavobacterium procerum]|uniref:Uncharacterized protein n=1 Tax=Flavobacterium procerum TaxID=1455569 RepID=A0ABV6BKS7_9FLAO